MVRRDGAETRRERITQIAKSVQSSLYQNKEQGWIPLAKTISKLMFETGLTWEKVREYLEIIQNAGQFEIDPESDRISRLQQRCFCESVYVMRFFTDDASKTV